MGGWIQVGPDAWQYSKDHNFGEQKELPRHRWASKYHKGKRIMETQTEDVMEKVAEKKTFARYRRPVPDHRTY